MKDYLHSKVIYLFLLSASCSQATKVEEHEIMHFERSDFLEASVLIADTIDFDKPLWPKAFDIIRDTIILVTNWQNNAIALELYNLNTKEFIGLAAPKGRGPGEYLACYPIYNIGYAFDTIQIYDPVGNQLSLISIDSMLRYFERTEPLRRYHVPAFVRYPALIDTARLVGWNFYSFKYQEIDNGFDRLFVIDYSIDTKPSVQRDPASYYDAINYSKGLTLVNPEKRKVFVADQRNAVIYIYNSNLELIKELQGPDLFEIEYKVNHESRKVSYAGGKKYSTYSHFCYTKDAVYLLYDGTIGTTDFSTDPSEVFMISWNGDLVHRYQLDQKVLRISVDTKEEHLYASSYTAGEYPRLLRYRLK